MFAVIKTGGKQYKVSSGDEFPVERLAGAPGDQVQFNDVLMIGGDAVTVGTPMIEGAGVQAEILEQKRGEKTYSFKRRRRKHSSKRLKGHRQYLTVVRVTDILTEGAADSGVQAAIGSGAAGPEARAALAAAEAAQAEVVAEETALVEPIAADPEPAAAPQPEPEAASEPDAPAETVEAVRPANLLDAAQGDADDLTRISGVGPKLAEKLNENGVYHFWQIAEWGPAEIAFMDDQLSFKGRIERDNWIDQAASFAAEAKE
ncbi:MAG: 50S ribosomal protein L21 [Pseudomonadota bacterium]